MIMIFPGTLRQCGGAAFLRGLLELAHTAKIPCSVHMDHAQKDEDIEYTLDMAEKGTALDSIMIDCSHADTLEENITKTKGFVSRAVKLGMATEAELASCRAAQSLG
jgi:fructose-bisphosphate aldolase class II